MKLYEDSQKDRMARVILVTSLVSTVLGVLFRNPILGTFTPGAWIAFFCFLFSLACVRDHGSNRLASLTFWISFLAMVVTILLGALG